jgi:hypothetical protein
MSSKFLDSTSRQLQASNRKIRRSARSSVATEYNVSPQLIPKRADPRVQIERVAAQEISGAARQKMLK